MIFADTKTNTPIEYPVEYNVSFEMLKTSDFSSNSNLNDIIENEQTEAKNKKLSILKKNIGDDLFSQLSDQQRQFIVGISGTISFGKNVSAVSLYDSPDDE